MVDTIHGFAEWMGSSAGNPANYNDPVDRYREDLILRASQLAEEEKFDAWVIDEAQDFLPSWWETLKIALKDPVNGKMALFGDDQQSVFGHRPPPEGFFASMRLTENLRNSQQIAKAVSKFIARPTTSRGPSAFEIEYVVAGEDGVMEAAEDVVANLTDHEHWYPGEIALLTTKKRHGEHAAQADSDVDAYWEDLWAGEDVFYCTIGGFKGLERPVVVLAINGFHADSDQNDVLYVGMSRARDKLVVVGDAEIIEKLKAMNS
jgi:superfamily I DNA/RNA helicase